MPPTVELVRRTIDAAVRPADQVIGSVPERRREITVEKLAANAVMAGCLPDYFPVVLAAAEAMLDSLFNLVGLSSSLGGSGVLVIVNGPVVKRLGINSRNNLFGPGNRANATIGRAIRLTLMNACGAIPGLFDRSILGHPGKYSYCIAEAEDDTHWTPLHVERGFDPGDSAVTVFACEGPRQVRTAGGPENVITAVADTASSLGTSMSTTGSTGDTSTIVRQGEIAVVVAGQSSVWDGWTKADLKRALHPRIRRSLGDLKRAGYIAGAIGQDDERAFVSLVPEPEDIMVVFAGGEENTTCAVLPSWGPKVSSTSVTRRVSTAG